MGGIGSGNHWRCGTRGVCEHHKRIDIRWLRKSGFLIPGVARKLSWSIGDEPAGFIVCRTHEQSLELDYKFRQYGGEWKVVNEHIPLVHAPQHFGGTRTYFQCLGCYRRCMVLYGDTHFRCRRCYNLAYASQNEDRSDRLRRKAVKIRRRIGGDDDLDSPFPEKPKGMHWQTYERLRATGELIEDHYSEAMVRRLCLLTGII